MSVPKKPRSWRSIVVNGQQFRWKFASTRRGVLTLQGKTSSSQQVVITLTAWYDPWLYFTKPEPRDNEPKVITTSFAKRAILFALEHGWQPHHAASPLKFEYRDKKFREGSATSTESI